MKIDPAVLEAPSVVRACPECQSDRFVGESRFEDGELTCEALFCADCRSDILGVYRAMRDGKR